MGPTLSTTNIHLSRGSEVTCNVRHYASTDVVDHEYWTVTFLSGTTEVVFFAHHAWQVEVLTGKVLSYVPA